MRDLFRADEIETIKKQAFLLTAGFPLPSPRFSVSGEVGWSARGDLPQDLLATFLFLPGLFEGPDDLKRVYS